MSQAVSKYRAEDIEVLEGLEPVRKRPGMYIGGTEGPQGLHHLVKEILDNAIDEAMNGYASKIDITLHQDQESVTIEDDGRGIPVDIHPRFKKSALELVLTTLHSGGKFSERNYVSAGGLHGVGASVVNALSERLEATVWRDGGEWTQSFERGKPTSKLERGKKSSRHGTRIFFRPDDTIFKAIRFSAARIEALVQEKAFLNRGLTLRFFNEATKEERIFCYEQGIKDYLQHVLKQESLTVLGEEPFYLERNRDSKDGIRVEVAFCWTASTQEKILSYVNGIHTGSGGSHEDGFKAGLSKSLRNYISVHDLLPRGVKLVAEDLREGLLVVLSINVPGAVSQLQFQGQTKDKLNNPELEAPVESLLRTFENSLNANSTLANLVAERVILAARARAAARSAAEDVTRKIGISHRLNLPGKLADCSSTRPEKSELFIVEGESAGGSAKQGRDRETQAVLPLKGKILNAIAAPQARVNDNKELLDLVAALGCGLGDGMRLEKLRYSKVIILTDADADGMHIASLLLAFFFKHMRPLIQAGHIYLGLPPLYRIKSGSGAREDVKWVYSEEEKEKTVTNLQSKAGLVISRFKGLGEMNPEVLWQTTLDPKTRTLLRVKIDSVEESANLFNSLFGKDTSERFRLIQQNAASLEADI